MSLQYVLILNKCLRLSRLIKICKRGPAIIEGDGGEIPDAGELSAPPNQSTELGTNTVAASFTVFGNLPTEVRFKIWKYALPSHKSFLLRVHVFRSVNKRDNTYKVKFLIDNLIERLSLDERSTQGLGLSRACRESRKMYNEEFPYFLPMLGVKQKGQPESPTRGVRLKSIGCLRFNKDTIICMQNMQELRFTADKPMAEPLDKFWFDIKHLAYQVNLTIAEPPPARLAPAPAPALALASETETSGPTYWFADQTSRFPNLETITTVVDLNQEFYQEFPQAYIDRVLGFIMEDAATGVELRKTENPEYKVPTLFFQSWKDGVPYDRRKYVGGRVKKTESRQG
jgi:hypothetical protein